VPGWAWFPLFTMGLGQPIPFAPLRTLRNAEACHPRIAVIQKEDTVYPHLLRTPAFFASAAGLVVLALSFGLERGHGAQPAAHNNSGAPQPVVVELFTSEGCSSCPPADTLLKQLSEQQPLDGVQVVALEEHVDYWNHLGWSDPFSSSEFSQRQSDYARVFGNDSVYTPQMIVDGQSELVGSRSLSAREAIQKAATLPKFIISLQPVSSTNPQEAVLELHIENPNGVSPRGGMELWAAVTEKNLQSDVKAGENSGELLKHAPVVRSLRQLKVPADAAGYQTQIRLPLEARWKRENLAAVVFLAEQGSQKIVGVGRTSLSSQPRGN